ncbi:probable palmitoyltransferase ZDHHC24 [Anthonomus grandis grandis]|uniref:probable palmitoyltransferase ZDHHC24 n=1 Tax=Anthonomus grandis grandis TaxID=2921223 RepID=UPI0021653406|nr:probable palmitoyltransferase ZDHHC24 [Anthonomus grandis grandis]
MTIRLKIYPKSISDALVTTFMFGIIPVIYYFELWIVLPRFHQPWTWTYLFHFCMGNFILFNLCSNLLAVILTDTSINGKILSAEKNWRFCSICETLAPPRSWHCATCNTCILKRDHHCMFTSCCIGHLNHRYFLVFVFYIFIATLYSSIFNIQYLYRYVPFGSWLSVLKIVFPLATLFLDWTETQLYVAFMIIVFIGCLFTGALLYYHLNLILKGMVTHERNEVMSVYDHGRLGNLKVALGERWFWVWVSPFLISKLPGDGIKWVTKVSEKGK